MTLFTFLSHNCPLGLIDCSLLLERLVEGRGGGRERERERERERGKGREGEGEGARGRERERECEGERERGGYFFFRIIVRGKKLVVEGREGKERRNIGGYVLFSILF